jgi:GntR family transcriptional regulator, trigonelline degradation regulator
VTSSPDPATGVSDSLASRVERVAAPLREQVLELLRSEIIELRLKPGQRLVERELIERIGVSRTTIREVLRQLATEGLVTTIPQRGAIVTIPSPKQARELYEVRALLEGATARECAANATDEQIAVLRTCFGAVAASTGDAHAFLKAKDAFYEALYDGAGNGTIRSILEGLQARIAVMRATSLSMPGRPDASARELGEIVEAVARRDGDAAEEAARTHVRQAAAVLFSQLDADGAPTMAAAAP